jgi:hypothetical protein
MRICCFAFAVLLALVPASAGGAPGHHHDEAPHPEVAPHGGLLGVAGDHRLELTFDETNGLITVYVLGGSKLDSFPIPARPLKLEVEPAEPTGFDERLDLELRPIAQETDPAGHASRFVAGDAGLLGLERYRAEVTAELAGVRHRVGFEMDTAARHAVFVCPMRCGEGLAYGKPGACPVCGMQLKPPTEAHGDHDSKHDGILFMAANGYHHLEGVLPSRDEFRLYLYNDFTRPIPASRFAEGSSVEIVSVGGSPAGEPTRLALVSSGDEYLRVSLPEGLALPVEINVRLQFEGSDEPDLFNFSFDRLSK